MATMAAPERDVRRESGRLLFRRINERVREVFDDAGGEAQYFFCECRDSSCVGAVLMTFAEYDALRDTGLFAVLPGHEDGRYDEIVVHSASYVVVRDGTGPAARHPARSRRTAPRLQRSSSASAAGAPAP